MFPWRIYLRSVFIQVSLLLIALIGSALSARYFFKRQFLAQVQNQIENTLYQTAKDFPSAPEKSWCEHHARGADYRLTLLDIEGKVFCDSHREILDTDPPMDRPEVQTALAGKIGFSDRFSTTTQLPMSYGALNVRDNWIARVAVPLTRLRDTLRTFDTWFAIWATVVGVLFVSLSLWTTKKLVFPLGRLLNKTRRLLQANAEREGDSEEFEERAFDEWLDLESDIEDLRHDLKQKAETINREKVELETLMGAISDAILAVDPEGKPLFYNSRFELLFGQQELMRRDVKLWGIFRDPEVLGAFSGALKEGKMASTKVIPIGEPGAVRSFFSLSVSPLRRSSGQVYGAVGIFHDITQLKSAEQMRIDFVANVSHELRTPLTSIKGYVDTLQSDAEKGKHLSQEFLPIISRNCERLLNLMKDLLDISSLEAGDSIRKEWIDTKELTERLCKPFADQLASRQQKLRAKLDAGTVFADVHRVEQVIVNLIDNATKYAPAGATIDVEWMQEGDDVILSVHNSGPGIPPEHHARLFERFYRVDKARSREQGGTGLGLAIVKHIMQRHEGSVWVNSLPGEGTSFFCRFPS